ncbi:putative late blight resistance protein R1B-16 [Salvia divinorum]|uniref:Late blight resistance protein R1B-16 n=1 Tax=Salvia divinorum TaxID=28513 RepID=A0ABD1IIS4_SALDI
MDYAALDSLAEFLDMILDHRLCLYCLNLGPCILLQKKQNIERLHENIVFLLNFLGDFAREGDILKARLTNAANQANNLFHNLESSMVSTVSPYQTPNFQLTFFYKELTPSVQPGADHIRETFCHELEKSIAETDLIRQEVMQIKSSRKVQRPSRETGDGVVGIKEDLLKIKSRLCEGSSQLGIIPIVGMGGIGKTTLARYAYEDPLSVQHFDIHTWLTISQTYNIKRILRTVLHSIKNVFDNHVPFFGEDDESLKERVYRYLKGRRYLIVMDDLWDTNVWDDLQRMFPEDLNGSRIIVTTRELKIASYTDSLGHPHQMHLMSVDQSWMLLKERVFGYESCPLELEKTGEVIAEKCRGLPLAVVVIAGVLSIKGNQRKDYWENIARNVSKVVYTYDEQFNEILTLSYGFLPSPLRLCFLYMGCFPEDYEINVSKLIKLWVAEGFLASNESEDMEELGHDYLEELAARSLVLINKIGTDGRIRTVKIHDLLRELCLQKCEDENFVCAINEFSGSFPQGIENSNRLSAFCNISGSIPSMETSPVHTIFLFKHWAFDSWKCFRLLIIFDGLSVTIHPASSSEIYIGELIHLRYLALTCESVRQTITLVSNSLYHLQNLQTLIFRIREFIRDTDCRVESHGLPEQDGELRHQEYMEFEVWRMPNLRHLILLDGFLPDPSIKCFQQISSMENLQTLCLMKYFKCSERILELLPNLKKLGVIYSYEATYETGWSQYCLLNLVRLHRLEKLNLFPWEDMRMIGLLPNLQVLKLRRHACLGPEWETSEGEFCQLKVLLIDSTDLVQWTTESSHFPKLERLTLFECNNLRDIPCEIGEIATLQLIEVDIRNSSVVESAVLIKEEQESFGNVLQVRFLKSRRWEKFTSWYYNY